MKISADDHGIRFEWNAPEWWPKVPLGLRIMFRFNVALTVTCWVMALALLMRDWMVLLMPLLVTSGMTAQWIATRKVYGAVRTEIGGRAALSIETQFGQCAGRVNGEPVWIQARCPHTPAAESWIRSAVTGAELGWVCQTCGTASLLDDVGLAVALAASSTDPLYAPRRLTSS